MPFPPENVRGPFSLDTPEVLSAALEGGGLGEVTVTAISSPMHAGSVTEWWNRVPNLAGPLATALAGMEVHVRDAISERALRAATDVGVQEDNGIVFGASVLIGSGQKAAA